MPYWPPGDTGLRRSIPIAFARPRPGPAT